MTRDGSPVRRKLAQRRKRSAAPVDRAHQDGHHARRAEAMAHHRLGRLLVALVRCHEIRGDQQQDDIGSLHLPADRRSRILAWMDHAVMPERDQMLAAERRQMALQELAMR
ncbi:hypothetical protein WMF19_16520 [Sorangium sp. So ce124]